MASTMKQFLSEALVNEKKLKGDALNSKGTILLQYEDDPKKRPESVTIRAGASEILLKRSEAEALMRSLKRIL